MENRVLKALGIRREESSVVSFLLIQSIFIGVFYGAFDISAHALFLSVYDEFMMARAYVISGMVGIVLTLIYNYFQDRMTFRAFSSINLVFITLVTLACRLAYEYTGNEVLPFVIFVLMGPLNILALIGFWGTVGRLFHLRQGKRLFGLVDSGQVLGIILSSYAVPLLLSLGIHTRDLLYVSALSLFVAFLFQMVVTRRFSLSAAGVEKDEENSPKRERTRVLKLLKNKYIRYLSGFVALSMITMFFVQYSFMAVTRLQYPLEDDMARFLGLFTGSLMIFTLILKTFLFSILMRTFSLRVNLAISPVLMGIFTLGAVAIGITVGYVPEASGFMLFFLLLALSRLFSKSLKDSIETPAFKVLYQSLPERIRHNVQAAVDGTINEIAALFAGILLTVLGALSFIHLIHFSIVLVVIILLWLLVALRLYVQYRKSIRRSLEDSSADLSQPPEAGDVERTEQELVTADVSLAYQVQSDLLYHVSPAKWAQILSARMENPLDAPTLDQISGFLEKEVSPYMRNKVYDFLKSNDSVPDEVRMRILKEEKGSKVDKETIDAWLRSGVSTDRLRIVEHYLRQTEKPDLPLALNLLRDNDLKVRMAAASLIARFQIKELYGLLCEWLRDRRLRQTAFYYLEEIGYDAVEIMENFYHKMGKQPEIQRLIVRLYGLQQNPSIIPWLEAKVDSNRREIQKEAILALENFSYTADEKRRGKYHQSMDEILYIIGWLIGARLTSREYSDTSFQKALIKEYRDWFHQLFLLSSLCYDRVSLEQIRENLEIDTLESVNLAMEMLDMTVDEVMKPKFTLLMDNTSDEEKFRQFQQFFTYAHSDYKTILTDTLNKDYNQISIHVKLAALEELQQYYSKENRDDLVAQLYNPNRVLSEQSFRILQSVDPSVLEDIYPRIPEKLREKLVQEGTEDKHAYVLEAFRYFETLSDKLRPEILLDLAGLVHVRKIPKDTLAEGSLNEQLFWLIEGELEAEKGSRVWTKGDAYIGWLEEAERKLIAKENSLVYCVSRDDFYLFVFNHAQWYPEITDLIIN